MESEMKALGEISILVNNVGTASADKLVDMPWDAVKRVVTVNVYSMTALSKVTLPLLLARGEGKRSAIVNVSSESAVYGMSTLAVYCGSKGYNKLFSESLALEHPDKIDVLTVLTGRVKTNMNSGRYTFTVMPDSFARHALNKLSWVGTTEGHPVHECAQYLYPRMLGRVFHRIDKKRREDFFREKREQEQKAKAEGNST